MAQLRSPSWQMAIPIFIKSGRARNFPEVGNLATKSFKQRPQREERKEKAQGKCWEKAFQMLATMGTLGKEEIWNHDTLQRLITQKIKADLSESCLPPHPNLLILQKPAEGHEADRTLEMQFYTDISGSLVKTPFFKGNSHSYMGKRWKRVIFHRCSLTLSPCKTICITLSQENELYLQQIYLPGKDFLQSSVLKKASWGVSCCLFYLHLLPNSWQLHGVFTLGNLILFILLHF